MKRLTICVLAMMAICVQAFATDITGKWKTTLEDDGTEIPCVLTITKSDIMVGEDNFLGGELTIKEITPTTLTLQDETGEDVIFTRIQDKLP